MSHLITIQSHRAGIGKTTLATNIATVLALQGHRVALIDLNFQTPYLHKHFQVNQADSSASLADFIKQPDHPLADITHSVTNVLRLAADVPGEIYLISNKADPRYVAAKERWFDYFPTAVSKLAESLALDFVIFDNHAGLNPLHMMQLAMSHTLIALIHQNQQDYQGTGVLLEIAEQLEMPAQIVIANEVSTNYDLQEITKQLKQTYHCHQAFALPHSDHMMKLGYSGIFTLRYSEHHLTEAYEQLAATLWVD